jgi:hypothetical protein
MFNATAPIKFIKANLEDSQMVRESIASMHQQHQQRVSAAGHGSIPAKHNLLAASMRLSQQNQAQEKAPVTTKLNLVKHSRKS